MSQVISSQDPGSRHDPRAAAQGLVAALVSSTSRPMDPEVADQAVDVALRRHGAPTEGSWPRFLDDVAHGLGLRVGWRIGAAGEVGDEVERATPVVTWTPGGWTVVQRKRGALRVMRHPGRVDASTFDALRLDREVRTWGVVEDALPAGFLGGHEGASPMRRLYGLLAAEREDLRLVLIYAFAAGLLGLAVPVAVQVLVNNVALGTLQQPMLVLSAVLLACLGAAAALRGLQRYVVEMLQRRVFVRMVSDLSARLPRVRLSAWDRIHGPEMVNRFFDVLTVQKSMSSLLLDGLSAALQAFVGMVLLALYHPALLGFDLLLIGAIVALVLGLGRGGQDSAIQESKAKYAVAGWLEEIAARPTLYKLGGAGDLAIHRADVFARKWIDARASHFEVFFRQYGGALALQAVANTALLAVGGFLVLDGQLSLGQLVAAEFIVATVLIGFAKFSEKLETVYDLLAAVDKLGQLIDLPLERGHGWQADAPDRPVGLRVDQVAWAWGGGELSFDDVSFAAAPGEHVALLGLSGAAQHTLADVLVSTREPTHGRILYDHVDSRELRLDALRRGVALVRERDVVPGSVGENVALGRPGITPDDVREALERVGLQGRIDDLNQGVATVLTPDGAPLTEGERARLAVARAVAGSPRLVVVDGLLDQLAAPCRDKVIRALTQGETPWTLVVLTDDPEVARAFDRTLLLRGPGGGEA